MCQKREMKFKQSCNRKIAEIPKTQAESMKSISIQICSSPESIVRPELMDIILNHFAHRVFHDGVDEFGVLMPTRIVYGNQRITFVWDCYEDVSELVRPVKMRLISDMCEMMQMPNEDMFNSFDGIFVCYTPEEITLSEIVHETTLNQLAYSRADLQQFLGGNSAEGEISNDSTYQSA